MTRCGRPSSSKSSVPMRKRVLEAGRPGMSCPCVREGMGEGRRDSRRTSPRVDRWCYFTSTVKPCCWPYSAAALPHASRTGSSDVPLEYADEAESLKMLFV